MPGLSSIVFVAPLSTPKEDAFAMEQGLEQLRKTGAQVRNDMWVPVSTRLPDSPDSDLDCIVEPIGSPEDREIAKCFYDGTAWWFSGCRPVEAQQCRVTHWLPARILPPMPDQAVLAPTSPTRFYDNDTEKFVIITGPSELGPTIVVVETEGGDRYEAPVSSLREVTTV